MKVELQICLSENPADSANYENALANAKLTGLTPEQPLWRLFLSFLQLLVPGLTGGIGGAFLTLGVGGLILLVAPSQVTSPFSERANGCVVDTPMEVRNNELAKFLRKGVSGFCECMLKITD